MMMSTINKKPKMAITIMSQFSRTGLHGSAPSPKLSGSSAPVVHHVSVGHEQTWSLSMDSLIDGD